MPGCCLLIRSCSCCTMVGIETKIVAAVLSSGLIFFRVCGAFLRFGGAPKPSAKSSKTPTPLMSPCSSEAFTMSMPTIRRRHNCRSLRSRSGLIKYAHNNTSQNGEDGIIDRLFDVLLPPSPRRYCVDVGAWDGMHLVSSHNAIHTGNLVV